MSVNLPYGVRTHGRLVNTSGTHKTFLFACGNNPCSSASRFVGRLVDTWQGVKKFLFLSECRHPKNLQKIDWVQLAGVPAPGVPSVVRVLMNGNDPCFKDECVDLDLTWDGSAWSGGSIALQSGTITVTVTPVYTAGVVTSYHINFSGACLTAFVNLAITCTYPLTAGGSAPLPAIASACCSGAFEAAFSPQINLLGYTKNRYLAREVDSSGTHRKFLFAECCQKVTCTTTVPCCGCAASPLEWRFSVSGVTNGTLVGCPGTCVGFNGTWTIVYGANPCGSCCWAVPSSESTGVCTPGTPWELTCDGTFWRLATQTGGGAEYTLAVASWKCFGPNTMTLTTSGASCVTFPATVTLTAV